MTRHFVSIIIPTYNDWNRLNSCLIALSCQSYPQELFEVIIVNNKPSDKIPEGFISHKNCIFIDEDKTGSYAARNKGLEIARGEIIGFTDSDCVPDKDWILNAVDFLKFNKEITRIGGRVDLFSKNKKPTKIELYDIMFAFPQKSYVENAGVSVTANLFSYRHVFDEVGLFNSNTQSGGDFEWGYRAKNKGFKIAYVEKVIVNHPARDTFEELIKKAKRVGKGQRVYQHKPSHFQKIREFIFIIRPKTNEVKFILRKGKHLKLLQKLYLIVLRHMILWTRDLARLNG